MFRTWLTKHLAPAKMHRLSGAPGRRAAWPTRLRLERLEDRTAPAIVTPFTARFTTNADGDIAIIGNTLETASTVNNSGRTQQDVINAQNGTGANVNNNNWNMAYVDVDNDPTTFNSSQATLTLPTGASVLFAGLYWGSVTTTPAQVAARNTVNFSTPASGGYMSVRGTIDGGSVIGSADFTGTPQGAIYQGFADVTSLVQAAGSGTYTVANVQAALRDSKGNLPYMGSYAGWSLVVAYSAPGAPERNLTVFDGYAVQQSSDPNLNIPISGFVAPPKGAVNAEIGVVAYEGDLGTTGDSMALNGKQLSDALNPANNFFNSVTSNLGVLQTAKNPNYVNQMGFDAKVVQAPAGAIVNGATSATITLSTSGDGYFPGVLTTAIDLYAPNLTETKTFTDVTGSGAPSGSGPSAVAAGDVLQYTVTVTNPTSSLDAAGKVVLTDPIPSNTQYVPGSLRIVSGANAGSKTDAAGDDQAEFNAASNAVVFRLGAGANASSGGTLAVGDSTTITFQVQVNPGTPANALITNRATTAFQGVTTGLSLSSTSNLVPVRVVALTTVPVPATVTLGANPVTLKDTADLEGGVNPTGTITFTLLQGGVVVDTERSTVTGNGIYTTPTGFTLPASGTVTGTYQWNAVYSGDGNNRSVSDNNDPAERVTVSTAAPTLTTTPMPATVSLGTASVTLKDTADLENGFRPTGAITFTLVAPGGGTVDTETVTVNGNGIYTTPTGFTLPAVGTATGTYQWNATYRGDTNNNAASDVNDVNESVTVSAASPTITTAPSPTSVTLGLGRETLTDAATLAGGFRPTGTITFALFYNGGATPVDTEMVAVNGNRTYTTPTGFTLPLLGPVTGTYQWDATYSGDPNNNTASDTNALNELVTVSAARPTLTTTPSPTTVTLGPGPSPILTDTADLQGAYFPNGTITFTLFYSGSPTPVDTETVPVNDNGTFTTPTGFTLPTTGAVAGTYQWIASFEDKFLSNNVAITDANDPNERVTVSAASPTLFTVPTPGILGANPVTLRDTAVLEGSFNPTGTITFTLFYNGGSTPVDTEMVTVVGDGAYVTPTGFTLPTSGTVTGTYQWNAVYSGDGNNRSVSDNNDHAERVTVSPAAPALTTTPTPATVPLGTTSVTLKDTADLENGYHPTGTITFTLVAPGGGTVDTEMVTVNGNGIYTTPTGFTLPTTGTVTGTYQWNATYLGDTNNNVASDVNDVNERVTVSKASLTLTTTPNPAAVTLGATPVTLTDSATLAAGFHPTGTITFTLFQNGRKVDTETATVSGNGTYTTPTGFTLPSSGAATGTFQWDAAYSGDTNNSPVSENNATNEEVTVSAATPTLSTIANPATVTLGATAVTLTDSATLANGYHPTGTIIFRLFFNGLIMPVDTETVTVNGNGTYTTPIGLTLPGTNPLGGTVTGTYLWDASYNGDINNNPATDTDTTTEQVTVSPANPTLNTTPSPNTLAQGVTLKDTAFLAGGFRPTGSITFTLFFNGGSTPVDTETVQVNGNGTYTTPTGFTPGTASGTYQWNASYSGDANNDPASDANNPTEQVTVTAPAPTLSTTPIPTTLTLGASSVPLNDTADLEGGSNPTGTITFTLVYNTTTVDTETATVNGAGIYRTPTGVTLPSTGSVTGTYQWNASYSGDTNNNTASDLNNTNERVTVIAARPVLATIPIPDIVGLGATPATLNDAAQLTNGFHPTGTLTFTLVGPGGGTVDTETVAVNGNGIYRTPTGFTLPGTGSVTGTYQWAATYSGDANNNPASESTTISDFPEQVTVIDARPVLATIPIPETVTLGASSVTLNDAAQLTNGFHPTGTITFTLFFNGGTTPVDTEMVQVNGNGIYTTPTGFTLPTGTVTGTYRWAATYSGDANNNPASESTTISDFPEQVTVSPANPTLSTTPSPDMVALGTTSPTLNDKAVLANGYHPTGTITFTLVAPGGATVDTEMVTVNGNGIYTTPTGFTLPSSATVTGTYQWNASYSGDTNNNVASDNADPDERVKVSSATPTLATTANPTGTLTLGTTSPTLNDTADLENGYHPTGTLLFTLKRGGATVFTQSDPVNGNGTYTTAGFTLPTTGTVTGTYTWTVAYSGDGNNNAANDQGGAAERVMVGAASPNLATIAIPPFVRLGATPVTLKDTAVLANGYHPTGTITFTLVAPGGATVDVEMATVNGNGIYTTPTGFTLPTTGTATGTYQWNASYSGGANNNAASDVKSVIERVTVSAASPTLSTTPSPDTVALGTTAVTLKDTAVLVNGFRPTGAITFTLVAPGGATVDMEMVTVNGNGTYTTPTGFTLSTSGTVTGVYQWNATYRGDTNNAAASDLNDVNEQVTVSKASPTLSTTPSPDTVTLGTTSVTLKDKAVLANGYHPTGTITFTLVAPGGGTVDTEMVTVNGNGIYTTPTGFILPSSGTVTGTYQWDASYSGDTNNNVASDNADADERVTVSAATLTLVTTANPTGTITLGTTSPTLNDTADLENGYHPTGTLLFTLKQGAATVFTQSDAVAGNGMYTTTVFTLPTTGTVTGLYTWTVAYNGDGNNNAANDQGGAAEQVTVSAASPTLTTTPNPTTVTLGDTAPPLLTDTADLEGGYFPTDDITFELFQGSTLVHTETVAVSGNGAYTTPTGFTLPTTGAVAGAYQWVAVYSGDGNNGEVSDSNAAAEQVTVIPASPTLVTTASPTTVTLPAPVPTFLTDTADLTAGFNPTGNIVFTLSGPGGFSYTQTDAVSGNGAYTASVTLPTTGTVAGTYTWTANYEGDNNNAAATDQGDIAEQTVVGAASLSLVTIASPNVTLPTGPPGTMTLRDLAFLSGGHSPTGNIVFTLTGPGGFSQTRTDTVNGNGTYTASVTLPTTGTVAGAYTWTAHYSGDDNNNAANDQGDIAEQTVVRPASPTLVTTASLLAITLGTTSPTLNDTTDLGSGYHPTGTLLFTLKQGGTTMFTHTDTVTGNGTYTTAGFTLPTTGTVTGTYTWTVAYSGDGNNNAANDQGGIAEQTVVGSASPTLVTTASPAIRRGTAPPTLTDSAVLSGGYFPTGNIIFTLSGPGGFSSTQTDAVNGNGTYTASTALPTTGTVAGTYTWTAHYSGDDNNNAANDQGDIAEQVTVAPFSPTITTTPNPSTVHLGGKLQDVANLTGGFNPTGSITFRLYAPGVDPTVGPVAYTETVTGVNGNGTYHTSVGFVANATGIWHWVATFNGDSNNNLAASGPLDEPVTVPQQADIALTKVVQQSQVMYGQNVTFTLIVHNKGPSAATDVFVDDPLPPGLAFVSATPSQGTFVSASGIWVVGTLANGATATLRLTARVAAFGPIVNRAEAGADQFDPDLSNNVAAAAVTGTNPAPIISKRSFLASTVPSPAPPAAGGPARPLPALDALRVDIVFINDLYEDVLGREAKPAELAFWINQLLLGVPQSAVARRV